MRDGTHSKTCHDLCINVPLLGMQAQLSHGYGPEKIVDSQKEQGS